MAYRSIACVPRCARAALNSTIYNLAREIIQLAGSKSEIRFVTWNHPDVELRIPNIDKARKLLGFEPKVDLPDGLSRTIAWYRSRMDQGAA